MGLGQSLEKINDNNIDNNIKGNQLRGRILRVVNVNQLIIAIEHNKTIKRILCKGKGYKLKNINDRDIAIGKINCLLNMSNCLVTINAHGINTTGELVVEIFNNRLEYSINELLLSESYIEPNDDIFFN